MKRPSPVNVAGQHYDRVFAALLQLVKETGRCWTLSQVSDRVYVDETSLDFVRSKKGTPKEDLVAALQWGTQKPEIRRYLTKEELKPLTEISTPPREAAKMLLNIVIAEADAEITAILRGSERGLKQRLEDQRDKALHDFMLLADDHGFKSCLFFDMGIEVRISQFRNQTSVSSTLLVQRDGRHSVVAWVGGERYGGVDAVITVLKRLRTSLHLAELQAGNPPKEETK